MTMAILPERLPVSSPSGRRPAFGTIKDRNWVALTEEDFENQDTVPEFVLIGTLRLELRRKPHRTPLGLGGSYWTYEWLAADSHTVGVTLIWVEPLRQKSKSATLDPFRAMVTVEAQRMEGGVYVRRVILNRACSSLDKALRDLDHVLVAQMRRAGHELRAAELSYAKATWLSAKAFGLQDEETEEPEA